MEKAEHRTASARNNWRKVFAVKKFLSIAKFQSEQAPADLLVGQKFVVGKKFANGAFGQLRFARHVDTNVEYAIKLEPANAKIPMLFLEYRFYKTLGPNNGFPKVYHFGSCGKYNALVLDMLGPNLEELFVMHQKSFSLKTVLQIAIQLIERVEFIHSKNLIYRDIKPENCLVGPLSSSSSKVVHMVDFGLAKQYIDPETGRHISYCENKNLTGTVRYMSVNAHQGKEQSRRDDLEALAYVFYYFISKGSLPWQGVRCDNTKKRYQIIGHIKASVKVSTLNQDCPWEFAVYLRYCRNLKFTQTPDYNYLKSLFRNCLKRHHYQEDGIFDWSGETKKKVSPRIKENDGETRETTRLSPIKSEEPSKPADASPTLISNNNNNNNNITSRNLNNNELSPYINEMNLLKAKMSKSLPASLPGDESDCPVGPGGSGDDKESYRRDKFFWKKGSKATSVLSLSRNTPTSPQEKRMAIDLDLERIPKVEVNEHEDETQSIHRENINQSFTSNTTQIIVNGSDGSASDESANQGFISPVRGPSPKNNVEVDKTFLTVPYPATKASNGTLRNKHIKQPTLDSAEIDKTILKEKRSMFYKSSMSDNGVNIVEVDIPGCCPFFRVFKKAM